jgi:Mg2+-importing ATPase
VLFVIRTVGRPWTDRPSTPLSVTTLAVVAIGAVLPFSSLAAPLGLGPLTLGYFAFLIAVVVTYLAIVEVVKRHVMRQLHVQNSQPM